MNMTLNRTKFKKVCIIIGIGIAYYLFVTITGIGISCPVYAISRHRIKCPGCGVSRACISLARFDLRAAFYYHPVFVALAPLWAVCMFFWIFDKADRFQFVVGVISIAMLLVYCILRNIPSFPLN